VDFFGALAGPGSELPCCRACTLALGPGEAGAGCCSLEEMRTIFAEVDVMDGRADIAGIAANRAYAATAWGGIAPRL
jgi:hypothetical protein